MSTGEQPASIHEMQPGDGFNPGLAAKLMNKRGHGGHIGLTYHSHGPNWFELALPWREELTGMAGSGILASGPIISLMDMASGMAIWQASGSFNPVATLDLRVDYQRPARERASVRGRVECYRRTRSAAFVRGIAHDGDPDDPVAHVAGVFMTIAADPREANPALKGGDHG